MKQGEEETQFVKEPEDSTRQFIFQKNKKTFFGAIFIVIVLIIIVAAIVLSGTVI
ncbi:hypothetical protein [Ulvibacterium marinum]|uniref:hypothetical protein n=1 Tax=Ulvibacterium marinum TaxID=2419782 RepID=UPI001472F14D|nr:hypothetical protein [Ulvibacterium marinum]